MVIALLALAALVANFLCYGLLRLTLGKGFRIWRLESAFAGSTLVLALISALIWLAAQAIFHLGGCQGSLYGGTDCTHVSWKLGAFLFDLIAVIELLAFAGGVPLLILALVAERIARKRT